MGSVAPSAPRLAPATPCPRKPFAHELVANVATVHPKGRQCPIVSVFTLSADLDALTIENRSEPVLGILSQVDFVAALPLDLEGIDVGHPDALNAMILDPDGIAVPDLHLNRLAR